MKAVPVIINALRALFHDEELQVEGLKMVKTLSMTSEVGLALPQPFLPLIYSLEYTLSFFHD